MKEPGENNNEEFDEDDLDFDESEFDFDDDEFDEEFEEESDEEKVEESIHEENKVQPEETLIHPEKLPSEEKKKKQPSEELGTKTIASNAQTSQVFSADEIPLSISVELGRLQLSIKKLMELEPGNLLELGVKPEQNVELTFAGKCIARGELLKIGDTLGVRILEKN